MTTSFPLRRTASPASGEHRRAVLDKPAFGLHFTDHMALATWTPEAGWHDRGVEALRPFALHPGSAVLHYAQEVFEGLKAYRHPDGSVWLFRPACNARRFRRSARRMGLPELPEADFLASVEAVVRADEPWVPAGAGEASLYLRPFMFAAEVFLGVRKSRRVTYAVIASPAQPYVDPAGVTLWVSSSYVRAVPGGTGAAKCGGNYGAGLVAQSEAERHGCDQVLYLDGTGEDACVEESGTMNLFLVTSNGELVTPAPGTILEGITRDTVLRLAPAVGLTPVERSVSFAELRARLTDGTCSEMFATGTAAIIAPVTGIKRDGETWPVGDGTAGRLTSLLRGQILSLQYGRAADTRGWLRRVV